MLLARVVRGVYHVIGPNRGFIGIIAEHRTSLGEYTLLTRECGCDEQRHEEMHADRQQAALMARWYDEHPYDGLGWVQIDHADVVGEGDDESIRYHTEVVERGSGIRCTILFRKLKRRGLTPGSILRLYSRCGRQIECWCPDFDESLTTGVNDGDLEAPER